MASYRGTSDTPLPVAIIILTLFAAGFIGWVMNIIKIVGSIGQNDLTVMFVARCVGVFAAPVGAILGWM
jgi:uncharacterized membrane protein YqhA